VIRPDGGVESKIGLFTAGYLTPTVPLIAATTPGTAVGGLVEWTLTGVVLIALAGTTVQAPRRRRSGDLAAPGTGSPTRPGWKCCSLDSYGS